MGSRDDRISARRRAYPKPSPHAGGTPVATVGAMVEVRKTDFFARWLDDLRDIQARARTLSEETP